MSSRSQFYQFQKDGVTFISRQALDIRMVYAPLCGPTAASLKSSITPFLSGDIKLDKDHYLTKPASREDLRQDVRNFFVQINGRISSLVQPMKPSSGCVEIGMLWHKLIKKMDGLEVEALNFIPSSGENVELMRVRIKNTTGKAMTIKPTAVVPIFGRSLANKHDHEHVTSLLHRIQQTKEGVLVEHVMSFNEEGHRENDAVYFVFASTSDGKLPAGSFPTAENFYGDGGTAQWPQALMKDEAPQQLSEVDLNGKEAVGAIQFLPVSIASQKIKEYIIVMGVASNVKTPAQWFKRFNSNAKFEKAFKDTKAFWENKCRTIEFSTGDAVYNSWLKWVVLQPVLRRIFGCSFLPDHDYGKGGKGWRDIWQDLLSLILIEPQLIRKDLINNFAGVRIDGSNATIIGTKPGEFVADRNKITRVWMDHGAWPLLTLAFYIDQTGDFDILLEGQAYFRDVQLSRTSQKDTHWHSSYGQELKDKSGCVYKGSILEHVLIQQLIQFFNVGEHNHTRLESADWNDGLDMAFERGESVAFTALYAGNMFLLAGLLENLKMKKGLKEVSFAKEVSFLLDSLSKEKVNYQSPVEKRGRLYKKYFPSVQPEISGKQITLSIDNIIADLRLKGQWMFDHIRRTEKVTVNGHHWFNGYYDNKSGCVEGKQNVHVRMTLTGQVFALMSGLAGVDEIKDVIKAVNAHLKDKTLGGIRLNTDFGMRHYLDLGRAFGFAYGTKENGAFFSHMTVMYAYALYKRGFAKEGYEALRSIYRMCQHTDKSKIYPGIPEYFDSSGKGMYHYLTGSASWLVLTQLTQVFGVRGVCGDLLLAPKLMKEEFGTDKKASVHCIFAGKRLIVTYLNPQQLDYGQYQIKEVKINGKGISFKKEEGGVRLERPIFQKISPPCKLSVLLAR
ncbi:MAG TPA: cellobiose phosphorylase [Candidatus Omnitrophota bacterium]|nr:cellobiose phosphorylase [Candidatus Omnitrophota bacterium]